MARPGGDELRFPDATGLRSAWAVRETTNELRPIHDVAAGGSRHAARSSVLRGGAGT
jgi:hypothetical protein